MSNKGKGKKGSQGSVFDDERFKHIPHDPRFRGVPHWKRRVGIDKRFRAMFENKDFSSFTTVDPRGRKESIAIQDDMNKIYRFEDDTDNKSNCNNHNSQNHNDQDIGSSDSDSAVPASEEDEDQSQVEQKGKPKTCHSGFEEDKIVSVKEKSFDHDKRAAKEYGIKSEDENEKVLDGDNEDEDEDEEEENRDNVDVGKDESSNDSTAESDDDLDDLDAHVPDLSRGEVLLSSSSDDDSDDDFEGEVDAWSTYYENAKRADEISKRLAVCNMDWDNIKATDLLVLATSFVPSGGIVERVDIYLSDFGKERMRIEDERGPGEIIRSLEADNMQGEEHDQERLRLYQLSRLKYYYAIITCDSPGTSNAIYDACDGMEYEATSNLLDLRFVPDDVTFEEDPIDSASSVASDTYEPLEYTTPALQNSKVRLTWDSDDTTRVKLTRRKFTQDDLRRMDLEAYVASSGSEDDLDDAGDKKDVYKALVGNVRSKLARNESKEMEVTWNTGLEQISADLVTKTIKAKEEASLSVGEKVERLRKEKKKARKKAQRNRRKGATDGIGDEDGGSDADAMSDPFFAEEIAKIEAEGMVKPSPQHNQLQEGNAGHQRRRNPKSKRRREELKRSKDKTTFQEDSRFQALFSSNDFAIDATNAHFESDKKGFQELIGAVERKRRKSAQKPSSPNELRDDTQQAIENIKKRARLSSRKAHQ
eukprot:gene4477-6722_t